MLREKSKNLAGALPAHTEPAVENQLLEQEI